MAITPNTVKLNHKLYTTTASSNSISFSEPAAGPLEKFREFIVENKPDWAIITRNSSGNSASVEKISSEADKLSVGTHTANVTLKLKITDFDTGIDPTSDRNYNLGTFTLKIVVTDTQLLTLSPSTAVFEYQLDGTQPEQKRINVLSESNWTVKKTKNWVKVSSTSGENNGSFFIEVTPSGLSVGTHTDTITVIDSLSTKTIPVSLVISQADTDTTFLYISPTKINVSYTIGGFLAVKKIEYNASGNWTAEASASWINLSATSGKAGVGSVQLTLQNTSSLNEGVYTSEISFKLAGVVKKVYVTLNVFDFVVNLLNPNTLYFTKENNLIEISSKQNETHLALSMATNYEERYHVTKKMLPFYNGAAYRRIGDFPQTILGQRPMLPSIHAVDLIFSYDPVELNLTLTEEDLLSDIIYQVVPVNGVQFLKGKKPTSNSITEMPLTRYLTKKGVLTFSVLSNKGGIGNKITLTGAVSKVFDFQNPYKPLYTAIIPIKELGNLKIGDSFEVAILDSKLTVHIIPEGNDHCMIFWENDNGVWDVVECTGDITEIRNPTTSSFEFIKDHNTTETKVVDAFTTTRYKINTGWIYNKEDVVGLSKLLEATNVYIQFRDEIVKVKPTTKRLELPQKNESTISYDLTFENVLK